LGAKSAAIIADEGQLYSVTLAEMFKEKFMLSGGKVVGELKILNDSNSMPKIKKFFDEKKADIYFLPVYSQTAARILEVAVKGKAASSIFIGGDAWGQYSAPFKDLIFKNSNPLKIFWASHFDGNENSPLWKKVTRKAKLAKNSTFGIAHAAGFDTTNIAYQAVMNAGGSGASPDKIAEALRKAQVSGLLGTVNYTDKNENTKIVHIFTASDGVPHHVDQK
jgi:ABC-type branched-subunit amino acid transport system substrate-binding protein